MNLKALSNQENFSQKENFVKCDWPIQISVKFFTMTFSEIFLSMEICFEWKCALTCVMSIKLSGQSCVVKYRICVANIDVNEIITSY
jgi:hypothetical protein